MQVYTGHPQKDSMMESAREPMQGPLTAWQAALEQGSFQLQCCRDCGRYVFYPRLVCPHCAGTALEWVAASGNGTVYSTTVVARKPDQGGPYNVALVDLQEGVRMMSRVEGLLPQDVAIGQHVTAFVGRIDGKAAVLFRPRPA